MRYSKLHRELFDRERDWPRRRMVNPPAWLAVTRAQKGRFNPLDHMLQVQRREQQYRRVPNNRFDDE